MLKWLATFLLLWFIYQVRHVFPPIIIGGILAYLLLPLVQQVSTSTSLSRRWATLLVFIGLFACFIGLGVFLGPHIGNELKDLAQPDSQREIVRGAIQQFAVSLKWDTDIDGTTDQAIKAIGEAIQKPEEIMHLGGLLSHGALTLLVCVVSSIYFTLDAPVVGRFFLRYFPEERRSQIVELTSQMNRMLSKYVRGQLTLIVIMSTVAWLILTCFRVKYALPIALFSGVLEVIPVLGPIIATTTAMLVAISQHGAMVGLYIVIAYTLARWIEDYIVVPKVIGHAVELHPLAVIFAVLCGETLAGGLGMLIAIPVAACVKLIIDFFFTPEVIEQKKASRTGSHEKPKLAETAVEGKTELAATLDVASEQADHKEAVDKAHEETH